MQISTGIAPVWRALGLSKRQILLSLRECGFSFLCEEFDAAQTDFGAAYARERLALLHDCGLRPVKARALSPDPVRDTDSLIRIISICPQMDIPKLVIPLAAVPDNTRAEYLRLNRGYLGKLLPAAEEAGVTLLIEHAGHYQNAHYTHCGPELNALIESMGCPDHLMVNVNIAHQGMADIDMYPDIRVLGSRIASVDASDNFFAMPLGVMKDREDLGLAPLMGFLDYDEVMIALKEAGYTGEINLRMNSPRIFGKRSPYVTAPLLDTMPAPLVKRYYAWAYQVMEHILGTYGCLDGKEARS